MSDYQITIRVKNQRLIDLMDQAGIPSVAELSRQSQLNQMALGRIANLKTGAFSAKGEVLSSVSTLCEFFGCIPEDLFPAEVLYQGLNTNNIVLELSYQEIQNQVLESDLNPENLVSLVKDAEFLESLMSSRLSDRENRVVRSRFVDEKTLAAIGNEHDISKERVRQILAKSLRKMRKPLRFCSDKDNKAGLDWESRYANGLDEMKSLG